MTEPTVAAQAWSTGEHEVGVLVLHGFTGNPVAVRPIAEALADAGYAVEVPLLPGHGTTWQEMNRTGWRHWVAEAVAGLERLRQRSSRQVLVGMSMGGTLALHLAASRGEELDGLVVVNPVLRTRDPRLKVLGVLKWVLPSLPGVGNDIAKPGGEEQAYDRVPLKALASLIELQKIVRSSVGRVSIPTLVLTSRTDHVVDPRDSVEVVESVTGPVEQVWLERSYHVATLDYDAQLVLDRTLDFVKRVTEDG